MQITIEVLDSLGQKLQQFSNLLPELLERGWQELQNEQSDYAQDSREIIALLASRRQSKFWRFALRLSCKRILMICWPTAKRPPCLNKMQPNCNVT